jgi:hypothetical protein
VPGVEQTLPTACLMAACPSWLWTQQLRDYRGLLLFTRYVLAWLSDGNRSCPDAAQTGDKPRR